MDYLVSTIVSAALNPLVASAFDKFKKFIKDKFGEKSIILETIDKIEYNPKCKAEKVKLEKAIKETNVVRDKDFMEMVENLSKELIAVACESEPNIKTSNITSYGNGNTIISEIHSRNVRIK